MSKGVSLLKTILVSAVPNIAAYLCLKSEGAGREIKSKVQRCQQHDKYYCLNEILNNFLHFTA